MTNDSYFYLSRQIAKFMMCTQKMSNSCGSIRTQHMSKQKMSYSCVCFKDESE